MLCTITDIKTRLGLGDEYDALLTAIVAGVTGLIEGYCRRKMIVPSSDVTEYLAGGCTLIQLEYYPIVSITSVKELSPGNYDYSDEDALTENADYRQIAAGKTGILERLWLTWPEGLDTVQAIYKGGYTAAGETPGTGETAIPADLAELAILQCCHLFKRRDDIGLSGVSAQGGSVSIFSKTGLLDEVKDGLKAGNYMRINL